MNVELLPKDTDKIICVKVGKIKRENLYEMTRKYWAVNMKRASKATHVLSIVDGIVEAVYIPKEWNLCCLFCCWLWGLGKGNGFKPYISYAI